MPATEFIGWQAFFSIYPFTFEREEWRHAELLSLIWNDGLAARAQAAGKTSFTPVSPRKFYSDFLNQNTPKEISLEQQAQELRAFKERLQAAKGKHGTGEISTPA